MSGRHCLLVCVCRGGGLGGVRQTLETSCQRSEIKTVCSPSCKNRVCKRCATCLRWTGKHKLMGKSPYLAFSCEGEDPSTDLDVVCCRTRLMRDHSLGCFCLGVHDWATLLSIANKVKQRSTNDNNVYSAKDKCTILT